MSWRYYLGRGGADLVVYMHSLWLSSLLDHEAIASLVRHERFELLLLRAAALRRVATTLLGRRLHSLINFPIKTSTHIGTMSMVSNGAGVCQWGITHGCRGR